MKFLGDFFPVLLFFIAYEAYDIYVATGIAIAASLVQVSYFYLRNHRVENMHLITLGLLVVFGGLTLALRDPVFIKWKPTVVNWLFAIVFAGSQLIGSKPLLQRMMSHAIRLPDVIWIKVNTLWALFFLGMGIANLYVAFNFPEATWVKFKLFGMMGLTMVFVVAQSFYMARHVQDEEIAGDS